MLVHFATIQEASMRIVRIVAAISALAILLSPVYDATAARPVDGPTSEVITLVENFSLDPSGTPTILDAIPVVSFRELSFLTSVSSGWANIEFVFLSAPGHMLDGSPAGARGICYAVPNNTTNCLFPAFPTNGNIIASVGSGIPVQG